MTELRTERLLLRQWREDDKAPFAAMNADPVVMEHFPSTLSKKESDEFVDRMRDHLAEHGWGLWALDLVSRGEFIGFVGLWPAGFDPFRSSRLVEIGWRLRADAWGHGYATEAAAAALDHAFETLDLAEVVSFTSAPNVRSRAVMRRLGMSHDPDDDFDHPRLPDGHRLKRHVLYRIGREQWDP